ncbi:MAG: hypothetical protein GY775_16735 [Candidatus Scalindua sp.]|nr:hypothetical protein [Candidatus Scalindua sp.]
MVKTKTKRFICVYFTSKSEDKIHKKYKHVHIVDKARGSDVLPYLVEHCGATYLKSIRDINDISKYYVFNQDIHVIEGKNNFKQ